MTHVSHLAVEAFACNSHGTNVPLEYKKYISAKTKVRGLFGKFVEFGHKIFIY